MTVKELRELLNNGSAAPWMIDEHRRILTVGLLDPDQPKRGREIIAAPWSDNNAAAIVALRNSADAMLDVVEAAKAYKKIMDANEGYLCEEELTLRDALAKLEGAG